MSFIEIKNISKTFNEVKVLDNLNIKVEEGTILGILGKSGSGKSVLINMLRGMKDYKPDNGQIIYNIALCPECLNVEPPSMNNKSCKCGGQFEKMEVDFWNADRQIFAAIRRRISIMLQRTFALYEDDTVIDNVLKSIQGHDEEESTYMAIDLLELAQMTHRITISQRP
jgi:methyl coenzyme M reductase system subunit A2